MIYGFLQGLFGTGLWVLAHECGHGSFSKHTWLNDWVGFTVHSMLLVPYFSWKYSHAQHHRYTGHMGKDTVFVPCRKQAGHSWDASLFEDAPILALVALTVRQLVGWPLYLLFNVSAGSQSLAREGKRVWWKSNHFNPESPVFPLHKTNGILLSDLGVLLMASILYYTKILYGWQSILFLYFVPYVWVNHWLG